MHTTNEAAKSSASTLIEFISNINPYLKNLYDVLMDCYSLDPDLGGSSQLSGKTYPNLGSKGRLC
jgi:hypothetical protein